MTTVNLNDRIESKYRTIHQIMYKTKDKKRKKESENSTSICCIHESSNETMTGLLAFRRQFFKIAKT